MTDDRRAWRRKETDWTKINAVTWESFRGKLHMGNYANVKYKMQVSAELVLGNE